MKDQSGPHLKFSKEVPNIWKMILFIIAGMIQLSQQACKHIKFL